MITTKATVQFVPQRVRQGARAGTIRALSQAAGATRKTARRLIRRRKKPSDPGTPPSTQTGKLKDAIRYDVDAARGVATVGPVRTQPTAIWHLHERGGNAPRRYKRIYAGEYALDQFGPVRFQPTAAHKVAYVRLRTPAQASRARKIAGEANQRRALLETVSPYYAPRPFMSKALTELAPRLAGFWINVVN